MLKTSASTGENVDKVWDTLRQALSKPTARPSQDGVRRARLDALAQAITRVVHSTGDNGAPPGSSIVARVLDGRLTPHDAAIEVGEHLRAEEPQ